jgi:predicted alpha-1,2-mannosidase
VAIVAGVALAGLGGAVAVTVATSHPAPPLTVKNASALVNPFVGTGSGGQTQGRIDTFPGAAMPFGMMQWSPDTPSRPYGGGYYHDDKAITGFSLTHVSGPGCGVGGDIPVLPVAGALPKNLAKSAEPFSHASETAHPGYYAVTAGGVRTQLAVTERAGVGQFTYPARMQERLLVKVAGGDTGASGATFTADSDQEISGSVSTGGFCHRTNKYILYFAARFSRPFSSPGTWHLKTGMLAGAYLNFGSAGQRSLGMRVAVSYVSAANARANLNAEARTWNVASVAARARAAWNRQLSSIAVGGGSPAARQEFYTALYHASLEPSLFSDANGQYTGFDGAVHQAAAGHAQYADFSGWDIYRSEVPLLATIDPRSAADMATSLLNDAAQGGGLPKWPVADGDSGIMNGDSADPILADTYAFGAKGFNAARALTDMVNGASGPVIQGSYPERPNAAAYISDGYVPNVGEDSGSSVRNGASETLEYAIDDFSVSRLAQALGQSPTAAVFGSRSQNWSNLFDTANGGYIEPRDAPGASPASPAFPGSRASPAFPSGAPVPANASAKYGQDGFEEGNAAQYTWMVPQDLAGVIKGVGGNAAAVSRLDQFFTQLNTSAAVPYAWMGNELNLDTPWVYDSAGAPWKTQELVQRVTSQLYSLTPGGEPGNDDLGSLSSWYVWAALGLYPQTPGVPTLVLGTPQFPREVIYGAYGDLIVNSTGTGSYVHGLAVNGTATAHTYVDARTARTLDFTLGKTPDTTWGTAPGDAPPSYPAGPVTFPSAQRPGS